MIASISPVRKAASATATRWRRTAAGGRVTVGVARLSGGKIAGRVGGGCGGDAVASCSGTTAVVPATCRYTAVAGGGPVVGIVPILDVDWAVVGVDNRG